MTREDRIDGLLKLGRVSEAQAIELRELTADLESKAGALEAEATKGSKKAVRLNYVLRFFADDIDAVELKRRCRRTSIGWGLYFGVCMVVLLGLPAIGLIRVFGQVGGEDPDWLVPFVLITCALGGLWTGGYLHLHFRRRIPHWIRLAELVESGIRPVPEPRLGQCPTCGAENPGPVPGWMDSLGRWLIVWNPGIAFNELVLGQSIPANVQECRECMTRFMDCPSCERSFGADIVESRKEALRRSFGHREGYPCPRCGEPVPSLRNRFAALLRSLRR